MLVLIKFSSKDEQDSGRDRLKIRSMAARVINGVCMSIEAWSLKERRPSDLGRNHPKNLLMSRWNSTTKAC